VSLFTSCNRRELQKIAKAADEVEIEAGRNVVEQNATGHEAFVILEGEAEVIRNGTTVTTLGPGAAFGELAILDGGPRTATVVATTPLRLLVLGQREFGALIDEVPGLAHKLLTAMARRIRDLDQQIFP
jgi:CRP-like cAMP-binding protein